MTLVVRRSDGKVILKHTPNDKLYETTFAGLNSDTLVLVDEDVVSGDSMGPGSSKGSATGVIVDLNSGRQTLARTVPGAPTLAAYGAQGWVSPSGKWYYGAQTKGNFANCVGEIDLHALTGRTIECAPRGGAIFYVNYGESGPAWTTSASHSLGSCRTGHALINTTIIDVGPSDACDTFDTTTLAGWQLWSTQGTSSQPFVPLTAATAGQQHDLGLMRPQTLLTCGGYAYWTTGKAQVGAGTTLMRWSPTTEPVVIFRPDGDPDNLLFYPQGCNDGHLTLTVFRYDNKGSATAQLFDLPPR